MFFITTHAAAFVCFILSRANLLFRVTFATRGLLRREAELPLWLFSTSNTVTHHTTKNAATERQRTKGDGCISSVQTKSSAFQASAAQPNASVVDFTNAHYCGAKGVKTPSRR